MKNNFDTIVKADDKEINDLKAKIQEYERSKIDPIIVIRKDTPNDDMVGKRFDEVDDDTESLRYNKLNQMIRTNRIPEAESYGFFENMTHLLRCRKVKVT